MWRYLWHIGNHRERVRRLEAGGFSFCLTRTERASKPTEARGAPFAAILLSKCVFRDCFYCFQWIGCVCDELRRIASQHHIPRLSQMDLSMAQLSSFHGWLRQNSKPRLIIRVHGACQYDNMKLTCLNLFDMSRIQIIWILFFLNCFDMFWWQVKVSRSRTERRESCQWLVRESSSKQVGQVKRAPPFWSSFRHETPSLQRCQTNIHSPPVDCEMILFNSVCPCVLTIWHL